ncbi:MAG: threonylcarbamoyl-AMP synthase [Parachlamydiales bacterium]|nr:threonylcarbamoyl-AMP synthase [Candidatus Acheromyda pituitae]
MTRILSEAQITEAASLLKSGSIVAFPTETVYGLGASIFQPQAISNIFKVKGRPQDNPLIAHVSSLEQVERIAQDIPDVFYSLAERFFPGPLTVVLKKNECVPSIVSAGLNSIALRMPSHPIARTLIEAVGEPIVAPSANISGTPSSTRCEHVIHDFDGKIAAVIDGGSAHYGIESTVISLIGEDPMLLRPGAVSTEQLEEVLQKKLIIPSALDLSTPLSPGMKYRHYAPRTPVHLFKESRLLSESVCNDPMKTRMILSREELTFDLPAACHWFALNAHDLYALLRQADSVGYQEIAIFCDELTLFDLALMNRILKAASCF